MNCLFSFETLVEIFIHLEMNLSTGSLIILKYIGLSLPNF